MAVQEQFVVDAKGKKTGVILPVKRYQKLMEDLHDLAVVAERRAEQPISLDEMKRRLKKDGILIGLWHRRTRESGCPSCRSGFPRARE
jgi:hypothetical protein